MSQYSIKDLEHLSGIKAHTLRIWEQRFNFIQPQRTDTNIRYYTDQDLKLVLNIALLKEHNHKISEIADLSRGQISQKVLVIAEQNKNYPDQIHALTLSMIDLDEARFEYVVNTSIKQFGFENTMINIVYPFLEKIGTLWITGSIGPAQEHFISTLIRQKIIVAIDNIKNQTSVANKKFVLFCPENEWHEIGLLFAHYIIKSRGHQVIFLGQSLPMADLVSISLLKKPDVIYTSISSHPTASQLQKYVNQLCEKLPNERIILSGYQPNHVKLDLPENVQVFKSIHELIQLAEAMP